MTKIARTVVTTPASPSSPEEVYSKCFEAKGCFGMPDGCVDKKDCKAMVTFHPSLAEEGKFDFVLQARDLPDNHYVALGLSHDMQMGNDLVLACSKKSKVCNECKMKLLHNSNLNFTQFSVDIPGLQRGK